MSDERRGGLGGAERNLGSFSHLQSKLVSVFFDTIGCSEQPELQLICGGGGMYGGSDRNLG